ncbi:MAG TPA: FAD-dependent monooxygenase [Desulfobacteria bacterium]|nr:FAD-dependent monooxygenase [Desulfobacteria bacterium]
MREYDVIVIGAGPAGATAAAIVADSDIHTLLIEKEKLPRPKICGGAVSQRALSLLEMADIRLPELKTFKKCTSMQLGSFDFDSIEQLANIKWVHYAFLIVRYTQSAPYIGGTNSEKFRCT